MLAYAGVCWRMLAYADFCVFQSLIVSHHPPLSPFVIHTQPNCNVCVCVCVGVRVGVGVGVGVGVCGCNCVCNWMDMHTG